MLIHILLIALSFFSSAQENYVIKYKVSHLLDTNNEKSVHKYESFLAFNRGFSYYSSITQLKNDLNIPNNKIGLDDKNNYSFSYSDGGYRVIPFFETLKIIYTEAEKKYLEVFSLANQGFVIKDDEKINFSWKITKDTSTIMGYVCQKATGHYKGRKWIVWFSKDFDYSLGPWKFIGLPGLVLSAYDEKGQISFNCSEISKKQFPIEKLKTKALDFSLISRKKLYANYKAYASDPIAYVAASNGINLTNADLDAGALSSPIKRRPSELKVANNPFQLE